MEGTVLGTTVPVCSSTLLDTLSPKRLCGSSQHSFNARSFLPPPVPSFLPSIIYTPPQQRMLVPPPPTSSISAPPISHFRTPSITPTPRRLLALPKLLCSFLEWKKTPGKKERTKERARVSRAESSFRHLATARPSRYYGGAVPGVSARFGGAEGQKGHGL